MKTTYTLKRPPSTTPGAYETDDLGDPYERTVFAHYFGPGSSDWYVIEYDRENDAIHGFTELVPQCGELGWASLQEMEQICIQIPLKINGTVMAQIPCRIERDDYWTPRTLREVLKARNA